MYKEDVQCFKGKVMKVANGVVGWRERKEKKKEMHDGQMK